MHRRTIAVTTLLAYSFWIAGCTSTVRETVIRDEFSESITDKIVEITLDNGTVVRFDQTGGHFNTKVTGKTSRTMIIGYTWDKKIIEADLENILVAKIEKTETNTGGTVVLVLIGIPVVLVGVIIIAFLISPPRF